MPIPAITTLRTTIANALVDNTKYQVFAFPPATVLANSVIVNWDDPMLTPSNDRYSDVAPMANLRLTLTVPLFDNEGNLQGIEDSVVTVFKKLYDSGLNISVGTVSTPSILSVASGDLLSCEMSLSILSSWS